MNCINCICCGQILTNMSGGYYSPETDMWEDGGVHEFIPGFGSKYDSEYFVIGICDKCIKKKLKKGFIIRKDDVPETVKQKKKIIKVKKSTGKILHYDRRPFNLKEE